MEETGEKNLCDTCIPHRSYHTYSKSFQYNDVVEIVTRENTIGEVGPTLCKYVQGKNFKKKTSELLTEKKKKGKARHR